MNDYNERLLKNVLDDYCEEQDKEFLKEIEDANDDSRFARTPEKDTEFKKLLNKEIKKADRKASAKKTLIRAASVFIAVCIGFTVMTYTVQGFKDKVWNFFANLGSQTHFSMNASTDEGVKLLETYEGKYIPSWIPDGYKIQKVNNSSAICSIEMNNNGKLISFTESGNDTIAGVDNEQVDDYEEIKINGDSAITSKKDGRFYLTMKKGNRLIFIMTTDEKLDLVGFAKLIEEK